MMSPVSDHVTLVEILELTRPFEEVEPLLCQMVGRLEREGVPALLSVQFYTQNDRRELGAVLTFAGPAEMIAHTKMIGSWEEFARFATMIKLVDMRVHGKLSPEVEDWMRQFKGPVRQFEQHVAGFRRPTP